MATSKHSQSEFEQPGSDGGRPDAGDSPGSAEESEFEAPGDAMAMAAESIELESANVLASVDGQLLSAKAEIEKLLGSHSSENAGPQSAAAVEANIVGVGIGFGDERLGSLAAPGEPVLEVYTLEPESSSETKARLASITGVQTFNYTDFPIHTVHTGVIDAQPHRMRLRPAPGGISVGHKDVTAGTLGCLVRGRSAPRSNRLMILSNNHVLANTNAGPIGAPILQPGSFDGGKMPADQVAVLERFVPISFAAGASNSVDCATGWAWPDRVRKELMFIQNGVVNYFRVGAVPVAPTVGMHVGKSGRTTQLRRGVITAVAVTVNVNYGGGRVGRFVNQFAVRAASGDFSAGGDSGSLIWTWDARRAPVGLLFAGGGGTTFANPIARVLAALDVNIVA